MPSPRTIAAEVLSHLVGIALEAVLGGFLGWGITARAEEILDTNVPGLQAVGIVLGATAFCVLVVRGLHTHSPRNPE